MLQLGEKYKLETAQNPERFCYYSLSVESKHTKNKEAIIFAKKVSFFLGW
jgi:hypothetical protein